MLDEVVLSRPGAQDGGNPKEERRKSQDEGGEF